MNLPPRIEAKIRRTRTCWRWTAGKDHDGYGIVWWNGTTKRAHRVVYELLVGPIPKGKQLDHVRSRGCRHRDCVRPEHLEPVECVENLMRSDATQASINRAKTHCPQGHPYDDENTVIVGGGRRVCLICKRESGRRAQRKRRAA